jgi:hypothetical protein
MERCIGQPGNLGIGQVTDLVLELAYAGLTGA